jgi:predicted nucleic acid-binding protein
LRCVLDTNVLVAALRSARGASRRLLLSALRGRDPGYWVSRSLSRRRRLRLGGAVPLDRAGRPRPAAGRGGRGLRAGEGARPTRLRWRHLWLSQGDSHLEATGLSIAETNAILDALTGVAEPVHLRFLWRPRLEDPADEMVLETAVNARADRIVTFNLHELKSAAKAFGILVVTPPEAWKEVGRPYEEK